MIDPEETSSTPCPHCGHSPGSARSQPADVQPVPCNHTTIPQVTPCCCGKYTFPTFELETMDWSSGPITDDYGVHVVDGCLSGLRVGGVQSFSHTVTVSPHEIELLIDGLVTMMQDMYGSTADVAPIVADNQRRHRDNLEALRQRLRDELTKEDNQGFTTIPLSSDDIYERVCEFVEDDEGGTLVVDDVLYDEISVAAKAADQTVEEWVHTAIMNMVRDTPVVETDG